MPAGSSRARSPCSPSCGVTGDEIDGVVHASTVASNTVLEGLGARTALVTTKGFRDVLEMRRLRIPVLYDIQYQSPPPLVPRRLRYEVTERLGPRGETWTELDEETRAGGRGADPPGRCRGGRDRAAPLLRRRRARAARRGDRPRGRRRRRLRDPLVGDPARDPRVRADEHGGRQRLRRTGDHPLPRLARRPPARGRGSAPSSR